MIRKISLTRFFGVLAGTLFLFSPLEFVYAQGENPQSPLLSAQKASVLFSPHVGTFQAGSSFDVPIYIDTREKSVGSVELYVMFDTNKLQVISPAGRKSIITEWSEAPNYSNVDGTIKFVGNIPGGITTSSGLLATITFKALVSGDTRVSLTEKSKIISNDALRAPIQTDFGTALYTILEKPPDGIRVFSDTHPDQGRWYNNNSPLLQWEKAPGITVYSYVLDDKPYTIPDNVSETQETVLSLPQTKEGISYFHIKALKNGVWGGTTHFLIRIDLTPLYGPPYKGTVLASAIAMKLGGKIGYTLSRKEAKDHGEEGFLLGAPLKKGTRVLLVDDVITTGGSASEAMEIIREYESLPVGCLIAFDRQEREEDGNLSAVQAFQKKFGIPVHSIATLADLISVLRKTSSREHANHIKRMGALRKILTYRDRYGVEKYG